MPNGKEPGPSILMPELYEKLKAEGHSKESAARISNAVATGKVQRKHKKSSEYAEFYDDDDESLE